MPALAFLAFAFFFCGITGAIGVAVASWGARVRMARARNQLLAKLEADARAAGVALLRGRISATGEAVASAGAAKKIIAKARWLSSTLGAQTPAADDPVASEGLRLETAEGTTALEGKVELLGGSRCAWARAKGYGAVQADVTLEEGDEVLALVAAPGSGGYRERDEKPPAENVGTVFLMSAKSPRITIAASALVRRPAPILFALAGVALAWTYSAHYTDDRATCAKDCRRSGWCSVVFSTPRAMSKLGLLSGDVFACRATSDADCEASRQCADFGECSLKGGECLASKDEDCRFTDECVHFGWCSAVEGRCRITRSDQCPKRACLEFGRCTVDPATQSCVAASDADCEKSYECKSNGDCHAVGGRCEQVPHPTEDDRCARSFGCLDRGDCSSLGLGFFACAPRNDADCANSQRCQDQAECSFVDGRCQSKHVHCRDSDACRLHGACTDDTTEVGCLVASDADCAKSEACTERGECKKIGNECAKDCTTTFGCREFGRCAPSQGACAAVTETGCKQSAMCADGGSCSVVGSQCGIATDADCAGRPPCTDEGRCSARDGSCVVAKDADCKASKACLLGGACTAKDGRCVAGSDDDCRASLGCQARGDCELDGHAGCGAAKEPCAASDDCRILGRCQTSIYGCSAKNDADCAASEVCKKRGWCTAVPDEGPISGPSICFARLPASR